MANDRITLVCDGCGYRLTLLKYYPLLAYAPGETMAAFGERVDAFMAKHLESCHPQWGQMHLDSDSGFSCVTEEGESEIDKIRNARDAA
jgi:hypothetical protein